MEQLGFDFDRGWAAIEGVVGRSSEPAEPIRLADAHKAADRVDVRARINREPPSTLADVLELVTEAPDLAPNRRRDLVSALRSTSRMSRRPLSGLPADARDLRVILDAIHPAAFGISAKRFANLLCDLSRAIALATGTKLGGRLHDVLTAEWRELRARCPSRWVEIKLHGFMRWCSDRKIVPAAVDGATLAAFIEHRNCHDLKVDIPTLRRQVARAWNRGVDTVPEWPRTALRHVPAQSRWTLPWSAFGAEFCADVDRWAERLGGADLFDEDAPDKPLRPISIKQSRFCVQMAASTLVASGTALGELRSLRDLVAPERMATILHGLRKRYDRKSQMPYKVAVTLTAAAEYYCKVDDAHVERLRRMCRRVLVKRRGMAQKNKDRLLPFQDPATRDRFLLLPGELMRSAEREARTPRHKAVLAQMAVALEIAQLAPMRARNLAAIEIGRHLTFVGHGCGEYAVVTIPEEETKNEIALEYPLMPETARLLRRYIAHHLPVLSPGQSRFLFPGNNGGAKAINTLSGQIKETIRSSIGHRVNVHLLRHFAAMIYLQAHPGAYEAVRRLLGHATASAALDMYVGLENAATARHFDEIVLRLRELAAKRAGARPGWRSRS